MLKQRARCTHIVASIISVRRSLSSPALLPGPRGSLLDVANAWSISKNRITRGKPSIIPGTIESSRREKSTGCHRFETPRTAATRGWRKVGAATTGSSSSAVPLLLLRLRLRFIVVRVSCWVMVIWAVFFCSVLMLVVEAEEVEGKDGFVPAYPFVDQVRALGKADISLLINVPRTVTTCVARMLDDKCW